jgi:hypothetical protein
MLPFLFVFSRLGEVNQDQIRDFFNRCSKKNIFWLYIPMHEFSLMEYLQAIQQLQGNLTTSSHIEGNIQVTQHSFQAEAVHLIDYYLALPVLAFVLHAGKAFYTSYSFLYVLFIFDEQF